MKAAFILAAFAALVVADGPVEIPRRCGAGGMFGCAIDETCVGEYRFKEDPRGICIKSPAKCGSTMAHPDTTCPRSRTIKYKCIPVADVSGQCPMDVAYCGHCVDENIVFQLGLRSEQDNRCGGKSGRKCFQNPASPEICAGERELRDGMGVCLEWGFSRQCKHGCFGDVCVSNSCPPFLSKEDCGGKICLPKKYADKYGIRRN
ncbi:hypothetical protein TWF696_003362 [Orbilia brochopaga]|uniref:Uncharacterized protein n=1 Tax=Orbilia brochopaga TaxID=3140254 RepID=A0AAV9TZY8_9PEZI